MEDDTTMDDGNVHIVPTPAPKLKSTIMGSSSRLGDGGLDKTKRRCFKKETDVECNSLFADRQ
jgi:hypothetical protein